MPAIRKALREEGARTDRHGNPTFRKQDIVKAISPHIYLPDEEIQRFVDLIFHLILERVQKGYRVAIENFGTFYLQQKAPRKSWNPALGHPMEVEERFKMKYKPTHSVNAILNPHLSGKYNHFQKSEEYLERYKEEAEALFINPLEDFPFDIK